MPTNNSFKLDYDPAFPSQTSTSSVNSSYSQNNSDNIVGTIGGFVIWAIIIAAVLSLSRRGKSSALIIKPYQQGVLFKGNVYSKTLNAGNYSFSATKYRVDIVDMREEPFSFNQNLLTSDNFNFAINVSVKYEVTDAYKAINSSQNYKNNLFEELRLLIRDIIKKHDIAFVSSRVNDLNTEIFSEGQKLVEKLGVKFNKIEIVDIVLPPEIRHLITQSSNKNTH